MCYSNYKDFGRDTRKDTAREPKERREPRVEAKEFKFWAFPAAARSSPSRNRRKLRTGPARRFNNTI